MTTSRALAAGALIMQEVLGDLSDQDMLALAVVCSICLGENYSVQNRRQLTGRKDLVVVPSTLDSRKRG